MHAVIDVPTRIRETRRRRDHKLSFASGCRGGTADLVWPTPQVMSIETRMTLNCVVSPQPAKVAGVVPTGTKGASAIAAKPYTKTCFGNCPRMKCEQSAGDKAPRSSELRHHSDDTTHPPRLAGGSAANSRPPGHLCFIDDSSGSSRDPKQTICHEGTNSLTSLTQREQSRHWPQ